MYIRENTKVHAFRRSDPFSGIDEVDCRKKKVKRNRIFLSNKKKREGASLNLSTPLLSKNKPRHTPPPDPTNF